MRKIRRSNKRDEGVCTWIFDKLFSTTFTQNEGRPSWDSQFLSFNFGLAYCTGVGNIWRFPYLCVKHGIAFLIPYSLLLLCVGLPMMFLELLLGQYMSRGPVYVFSQVAPICAGIGWSAVLISATCSLYYNLVISWIIHYLWDAIISVLFNNPLPWATCDLDYINSTDCFTLKKIKDCLAQGLAFWNNSCVPRSYHCERLGLQMHDLTHCKSTIDDKIVDFEENRTIASDAFFDTTILGNITNSPHGDMVFNKFLHLPFIFYFIAWLIVLLCLRSGIRVTGKITQVTVAFPYLVLFILLITKAKFKSPLSLTNELNFSFENLYSTTIWRDAGNQVLFSLGVAFGCLPTIASYNNLHQNIVRDSFMLVFYNMMTSIFCSILMYSTICSVSKGLEKDIAEIMDTDRVFPFKIYASTVDDNSTVAICFFIMLFTMAIDTQLIMVETVVSTIQDQWSSSSKRRGSIVFIICLLGLVFGMVMCTDRGMFIFEILLYFSGNISLYVVALSEVIAIAWIFGFSEVLTIIKEMKLRVPECIKLYLWIALKFITPTCLVLLMILSLYESIACGYQKAVEEDGRKLLTTCTIQKSSWQSSIIFITSGFTLAIITVVACFVAFIQKDVKYPFSKTDDCCPEIERNQRSKPKNIYRSAVSIYESSQYPLPDNYHTIGKNRNDTYGTLGYDNTGFELRERNVPVDVVVEDSDQSRQNNQISIILKYQSHQSKNVKTEIEISDMNQNPNAINPCVPLQDT